MALADNQSESELPRISPQPSPWSMREKIGRLLWGVVGQTLYRLSFHNWYRYRALLLRSFGATVGRGTRLRRTVKIEVPWMLKIDEGATVGDHAILYSLGAIHLGPRATVSQYAHLCAGTHDFERTDFPLLRQPISIGADVWIGADVFVGPGVSVGHHCVVGARSSVFSDLPAGQVCVGSPARTVRPRLLREPTAGDSA